VRTRRSITLHSTNQSLELVKIIGNSSKIIKSTSQALCPHTLPSCASLRPTVVRPELCQMQLRDEPKFWGRTLSGQSVRFWFVRRLRTIMNCEVSSGGRSVRVIWRRAFIRLSGSWGAYWGRKLQRKRTFLFHHNNVLLSSCSRCSFKQWIPRQTQISYIRLDILND